MSDAATGNTPAPDDKTPTGPVSPFVAEGELGCDDVIENLVDVFDDDILLSMHFVSTTDEGKTVSLADWSDGLTEALGDDDAAIREADCPLKELVTCAAKLTRHLLVEEWRERGAGYANDIELLKLGRFAKLSDNYFVAEEKFALADGAKLFLGAIFGYIIAGGIGVGFGHPFRFGFVGIAIGLLIAGLRIPLSLKDRKQWNERRVQNRLEKIKRTDELVDSLGHTPLSDDEAEALRRRISDLSTVLAEMANKA